MRIEIDIPKEFEEHFKQDKFKDSFERIMADIKHSLENGDCLCAGRYEYETIEMLEKALENSRQAYSVDKIIEELELHSFELGSDTLPVHYVRLNEAIEIVKQSGDADDTDNVCEWKKYPYKAMERVTNKDGRRGWKDNPRIPNIHAYNVSGLSTEYKEIKQMNNNQEIRNAIAESKLKKYQIANELGVTVYTFSHWLQTDLNEERTKRIYKAIQDLKG